MTGIGIFLYALAFFLPLSAIAQYSEAAFDLKSAQDTYDERGLQGAAISVDGNLAISNQNGGVTWTYPISGFTSAGHQVGVSLNYCSSVQFTAFSKYSLANRNAGSTYSGWEKFHQNRAAWILSVNGWAINVISVTPHFTGQPGWRLYNNTSLDYDDKDVLWMIDGYDFSNRMRDFGAVAQAEPYRDVIRILRGDGSVMELLNVHTKGDIDNGNPDSCTKLYTGTYFVNEANSHAYGVVEYATNLWPGPVSEYILERADTIMPQYRQPTIPRILKFYPGDGTEILFTERVAPFGLSVYTDNENRSGGLWGHPTIFYLEQIRSNNGIVVDFQRTRHYPELGSLLSNVPDLTRGRALTTSFTNTEIRFGYNSLIVESMGRTTKVKFDTISRCGNAGATEVMPFANLGAMSPMAEDYAEYDEQSALPYRGFLGYVTQIIDPENRVTRFDYESYTKRYKNMGFPHNNGTVTLSFKNYRLKEVKEPVARYTLRYYGNKDETIWNGTEDPKKLNNMVDSVRKFAPDGTLLTTDVYDYLYSTILTDQSLTSQRTTDHITGHSKYTEFLYQSETLNSYVPILSPSRHTVLKQTIEQAGPIQINTQTSYATATNVPSWGGHTAFTTLPVSQTVAINGITKSHQEFYYELDTLRKVWADPELSAKYGMEIGRKITKTIHPADPAKVLLTDTTTYLHLPMLDTTVTWAEASWDKFKTLANYFYLRDTVQDPAVVGKKWEEISFRAPVAVFDVDTVTEEVRVPPLFGLEERSWITDTTGAVAGKRNVYLTNILEGGQKSLRGKLIADSVLGSNGQRLLNGAYNYTRFISGELLSSKKNALGVETHMSYGYSFCDDIPFWEQCTDPDPTGTIVANDGTTRPYTLQWSPFASWFAQPAAVRQKVRWYDAGGNLRTDTMTTFSERTFHGQASATLEPNGYVSTYDYDYNGRLNAAWLPLDYPGTGVLDTFTYEGPEYVDLLGTTYHHRRSDTMFCDKEWDGQNDVLISEVLTGPVLNTVNHDTLYASLPVTRVPECPPISNSMPFRKVNEKDDDRQLLIFYKRWLPYSEYAGHKGFVGRLSHNINAISPLKSATRIDSLSLDLMVTSAFGDCIHLEVSIDSIFKKTFVFNCSSGEDPGDDDPPGNEMKARGRSLQSSGITQVAGGYKLVVDLDTVATQLRNRPIGSLMNIDLRMKTPGGSIAFINGTNAEDLRPRLNIYGEYQKVWDRADYTVAYEHNNNELTTTISAKVDDARHTMNDLSSQGIAARRTNVKNFFGANYQMLKTERLVIDPDGTRTDTAFQAFSGLGSKTRVMDTEGDTIVTRYDFLNRPVITINSDGTRSMITYIHARPDSFNITDQDLFGYCDVKIVTNETGVKFAQFSDAFGRMRREIADYGDSTHLNLTTKYEYDLLGRLVQVTNPKGQVTAYTHDAFGRVLTKTQPDLGTVGYAYDDLGNVRFVQDEKQTKQHLLTYNQYDDMNRLTLIGEAYIDEWEICGPYNEDNLYSMSCGNGSRLIDGLDPNKLHIFNYPSPVTANPTIFKSPLMDSPVFGTPASFKMTNCDELQPEGRLGETELPPLPLVTHLTKMYTPRNGGVTGAWLDEFEDLESFPDFARIGIQYDRMPVREGAVWKAFPSVDLWNRLAPTGVVRNLKEREVAVAYRDKSAEPFHYSVLSYDERGRVEALLRYNENLGFDAVYYSYNSLNKVISVTVADPMRKFTTWYGYDAQGRIDSVWTKLYPVGSGLTNGTTYASLRYPSAEGPAGIDPAIVYSYTKTDRVKTMRYPEINVLIDYAYNHRKFLDSLVAKRTSGGKIFTQRLSYDSTGQIIAQDYRHFPGAQKRQEYEYDPVQRLMGWERDGITEAFSYDEVGNRQDVTRSTQPTEIYWYHSGTNRLWARDQQDALGNDTTNGYGYNDNGALRNHTITYNTPWQTSVLREEQFDYSFRGLMTRARVRGAELGILKPWEDWRYRYNAMGEREQKRMYPSLDGVVPAPDSSIYPWVYYLLGGNKQQLAVYHGQHLDSLQSECEDFGKNRVYLYPFEYITNGMEGANLVTRPTTGVREYKLMDHLGSTRVVLNGSGTVISQIDNSPFGEQIAVTGLDSRKQFIDKEKDGETGTANHGVRQYDPERGSFTSLDAAWEKFPSQSPYHYSHNNPVNRLDANGLWDITVHFSKDREKNACGVAIVTDRNGNEVFKFLVRGRGVGGRDRMQTNGDTPTGLYDIPDDWTWHQKATAEDRQTFGPNPRLVLQPISGEALESGRTDIRLHSGRQEDCNPKTGQCSPLESPELLDTHGCLRAFDDDMKKLKEVTDALEANDPKETPDTLEVLNDVPLVGDPEVVEVPQ